MNILNKFTLKSLSKNKKRTIVTIIGVALSTALICAVAGMIMSFKLTAVESAKRTTGEYHYEFSNVPKSELKYIENNAQVKSYYYGKELGYSILEGCANEDKPYLYFLGYTDEALDKSAFKLTKGRMPENDSEVIISSHIISNGRVKLNVGDTLKVEIGTRQTVSGYRLDQSNPYHNPNAEDGNGLIDYGSSGVYVPDTADEDLTEKIINKEYKEYTIVGIIERPYIEDYSAPGYTVVTKMSQEQILNTDEANIFVITKNPGDRGLLNDFENNVINTVRENTGVNIDVNKNSELLRYEGNLSDSTLNALYTIGGIVIAIIIVSSVFVIRNSFSISVSEKTKQYGMLASVGATSKQIRKSVLFEATFIALIGIPLGIICGIIAIAILIWLVNILLIGSVIDETFKFVYGIPAIVIIITFIASTITIYLSALIPAIRASKITPIDAIRGSKDIKIKPKKVKTSKLTKKVFGIGGVIASKNLKRSKKKYRTTVISIVVSISIFIGLSTFLEYGKKTTSEIYKDYNYNFVINSNYQSKNEKEQNENKLSVYKEIIKDFDLDDYSYSYASYAGINLDIYGTEENKEYHKKHWSKEDVTFSIGLIKLNKEYFEKYLNSLGMKYDPNAMILIDDFPIRGKDEKTVIIRLYNLNAGDKVKVDIANKGEQELTITKVTEKRPMGYENSSDSSGQIFMSEENPILNTDEFYLSRLCINAKNADELEAKLLDISKTDEKYSDISINNVYSSVRAEKRIILVISIFLYGFIAVITLIGVTNIFNTITTNMILRSKEFAMLKSVGMTSKEFNKMIRLESLLYGLKSLIIGIPIGILLSLAIYLGFANTIEFKFLVPGYAILLSIIFVFVIIGLTMKYSLNKINKQNIVETIRNDNI